MKRKRERKNDQVRKPTASGHDSTQGEHREASKFHEVHGTKSMDDAQADCVYMLAVCMYSVYTHIVYSVHATESLSFSTVRTARRRLNGIQWHSTEAYMILALEL